VMASSSANAARRATSRASCSSAARRR
jgi:hypothetical protein